MSNIFSEKTFMLVRGLVISPHVIIPYKDETGLKKTAYLLSKFFKKDDLDKLNPFFDEIKLILNQLLEARKQKNPNCKTQLRDFRTPVKSSPSHATPEGEDGVIIRAKANYITQKGAKYILPVQDIEGNLIPIENANEFYSGCTASTSVRLIGYDMGDSTSIVEGTEVNIVTAGVSAYIVATRKVADGEPLNPFGLDIDEILSDENVGLNSKASNSTGLSEEATKKEPTPKSLNNEEFLF